jgi:hypothetical protein
MKVFGHIALLVLLAVSAVALAQEPHQRLVLKDGTYQVVTAYRVVGDRVRYQSAERGGEWEELPKDLVDWPATEKWARDHKPGAHPADQDDADTDASGSSGMAEAAAIDKQTQAERADLAARTPEVAPNLRLPDETGVFIVDYFHDQPEILELKQASGDLNNPGHNVLRQALHGIGGSKQLIHIEGARAKTQLHVNQPAIYVSLDTGDDGTIDSSSALTVDTHGAGSVKDKNQYSSPNSRYEIVRVELRHDLRVVGAMKVSLNGKVSRSEDVVETNAEILPGKHWMKLTPKEPLTFGEYALMEELSPTEINLDVWDFGVDPRAPDNKNARTPLQTKWGKD